MLVIHLSADSSLEKRWRNSYVTTYVIKTIFNDIIMMVVSYVPYVTDIHKT